LSDNEWSPEAAEVLNSLTNGLIIQAQVAGYTQDGLPEVYLYACLAKDVSISGHLEDIHL
jgi:A-kinase anchor protein 1, mitochondrial